MVSPVPLDQRRVALEELRAAIYLNPESIAPEAISPPNGQPESIEIYNDYIQALRASSTPAATLKNGRARRSRAAGAGLQETRRGGVSSPLESRTPRSAG